jgi:signal peptidase I
MRRQSVGRRSIRDAVLPVVTAGVLVFLVHGFVIQVFTVSSASMAPTLLSGDSVLVNRFVYHLHPPGRGDIIALLSPQADGREFVKRVVGLPGDVVTERSGRFFVNGAPVPGTQANGTADAAGAAVGVLSRRVPAGQLYVLGDNPGTSMDSRFWGTVAEREVVGEAFLICWSRGRQGWEVRWGRIGRWLR